ncbi:MAG: 23S rRNA (guanosine(2251)-2'-O)-methyltransferase RlmB [Bacilli bacterium]
MYVYGKNAVKEYIKNNKEITKIYLWDKFSDEKITSDIKKINIIVEIRTKKQLDQLVSGVHQGIILEVPDYQYTSLRELIDINPNFLVILDHLEDPHNFGAIIRTCEAANVNGIIIPKDRSVQVNETVMKVSTGALNNIKICQVTNLVASMKELKKEGFWFIGTDMDGTNYNEIDYSGKIGIVIGNEGFGMSRLVKEECDFVASIPMYGHVNSLNASVATGIILYKALDKR